MFSYNILVEFLAVNSIHKTQIIYRDNEICIDECT